MQCARESLNLIFVNEFIVLVHSDRTSIPRFDTEKRSMFAVWSPESDSAKIWVGNLDTVTTVAIDETHHMGSRFLKVDGILIKEVIAERYYGLVFESDRSVSCRIKFQFSRS